MVVLQFEVSMKDLVIFGIGQTSEIVSFYFKNFSDFNIVAYTVDGKNSKECNFLDKPVVDFEELEKYFPAKKFIVFVAIGYSKLNKTRSLKFFELEKKGYQFASFIHPSNSGLKNLNIGKNCFLLEHQSIQPFSKIGNNCFIWSGVLLGHHSIIRDHCWITSEVSIGGNSSIGESCFLGINSTIGHFVDIGHNCFIGANALITRNAKANSVFIEKDTELYRLNTEQFLELSKIR